MAQDEGDRQLDQVMPAWPAATRDRPFSSAETPISPLYHSFGAGNGLKQLKMRAVRIWVFGSPVR
jgi:hypothetical protein